MNALALLRNPTLNAATCVIPVSLVSVVLALLLIVLAPMVMLTVGQNFALAGLLFNLGLVQLVGLSAREQLTYAFTAALPNHQVALGRHLVVVGVVANLILVLAGVLVYRIPGADKADLALLILAEGLTIYFLLTRWLLATTSMSAWNLVFISGWLAPQFLGAWGRRVPGPFFIDLTMAARALLLIMAGLSIALFWKMVQRQRLSRGVMDLPVVGGIDSGRSLESLTYQGQCLQSHMERSRQQGSIARWVAGVRLPGYGCVVDHLNVVINRSLTLMVLPTFWIIVGLLCVLTITIQGRGSVSLALIFYPVLFMQYLIYSVDRIGVSPLLPYSRTGRATALLASNLLALLLFSSVFLLIELLVGVIGMKLELQGSWGISDPVYPQPLILALLVTAPLYFLAQLWLTVVRSMFTLVMMISVIACMVVSFIANSALRDGGQEALDGSLVIWLVVGWGLYLGLLILRFRRGSLVQA